MVDKENTQFVYTFSSVRNFPLQLVRSIRTLKDYVEPEQITVFYTPPYDERDQEVIEELGVNLVKEENETEAFSALPGKESMNYGEKTKLCKVDSENVVFLDCDTLVLDDIWQVIEGEFDFKARPDPSGIDGKWREVCESYGKPFIDWIPNAGFLVFKNNLHKEIRKEWGEILAGGVDYYKGGNNEEQFALALTISDKNYRKMTQREHFMEFADSLTNDAIVHHLVTQNTTVHQLLMALFRNLPFGGKIRRLYWGLNG